MADGDQRYVPERGGVCLAGGTPAKSGVGGGIVAIVPHEMATQSGVRNWMMPVTRLRALPS